VPLTVNPEGSVATTRIAPRVVCESRLTFSWTVSPALPIAFVTDRSTGGLVIGGAPLIVIVPLTSVRTFSGALFGSIATADWMIIETGPEGVPAGEITGMMNAIPGAAAVPGVTATMSSTRTAGFDRSRLAWTTSP